MIVPVSFNLTQCLYVASTGIPGEAVVYYNYSTHYLNEFLCLVTESLCGNFKVIGYFIGYSYLVLVFSDLIECISSRSMTDTTK